MVNPNSWYISMHFDRLTFELLAGDDIKEKELKKKKKLEAKNNPLSDEQKSSD